MRKSGNWNSSDLLLFLCHTIIIGVMHLPRPWINSVCVSNKVRLYVVGGLFILWPFDLPFSWIGCHIFPILKQDPCDLQWSRCTPLLWIIATGHTSHYQKTIPGRLGTGSGLSLSRHYQSIPEYLESVSTVR